MNVSPGAPEYVDDLGSGLIRRWSNAADEGKIAALSCCCFSR